VGRENAARIDFLDFTFDYKELPEGSGIKVLVKRPRRLFAFGTTVRRLYSHSVVVSTPETLLPFERREDVRTDCGLVAQWKLINSPWFRQAMIANIGARGLLIESEQELPTHGSVYVEFRLKPGTRRISILGEVRHRITAIRGGKNVFVVGLAFQGIRNADKRRVTQYIRQTMIERRFRGMDAA